MLHAEIPKYKCVSHLVKKAITSVKKKARRRHAYSVAEVKPYHRLSKASKEKVLKNARKKAAELPKEIKKKRDRKSYLNCREKRLETMAQYRQDPIRKEERRVKLETDPGFLAEARCRRRLHTALSGNNDRKSGNTMDLIGCTRKQLVEHLKSFLKPGERINDKHVDHVFPFKKYNMSDPDMQRRVMHYSNLQLLDGTENIKKKDKLPLRHMAARVQPWAWPPGTTMEDLPTSY